MVPNETKRAMKNTSTYPRAVTNANVAAAQESRRKLWDELHPGPPPPISHPIPKLTLPPIPGQPRAIVAAGPARRKARRRRERLVRFAVLTAACLIVQGCTMVSYTSPSGERFMRSSFGATTAIAALSVESGTNGVRRVEMHGYTNDANQALGTVTEAAVRAALAAPK